MIDMAGAGNRVAEKLGARLSATRHLRRLGRMHVEVTRARMMNVARQHALEHLVQAFDVRVVDVARTAARLHEEQRVTI